MHQWPPCDSATGGMNDWPEDENKLYCLESFVTETSAYAVLCMPGYPLRAAEVISRSGENALKNLVMYFHSMTRIVVQGYYLGTSSMKFAKHQADKWSGVSFPLVQILSTNEDGDYYCEENDLFEDTAEYAADNYAYYCDNYVHPVFAFGHCGGHPRL